MEQQESAEYVVVYARDIPTGMSKVSEVSQNNPEKKIILLTPENKSKWSKLLNGRVISEVSGITPEAIEKYGAIVKDSTPGFSNEQLTLALALLYTRRGEMSTIDVLSEVLGYRASTSHMIKFNNQVSELVTNLRRAKNEKAGR